MNTRNVFRFERANPAGFTLIELIIVITLTSIVGVLVSLIASSQMDNYMTSTRRALLVTEAGAAIAMLQREINRALPNSVRVSTDGKTLQMVPYIKVARYREALDPTDSTSDLLDFTSADNRFQVLGQMDAVPVGTKAVINHRGVLANGLSVYFPAAADGSHVMTTGTVSVEDGASGDFTVISPAHRFAERSVSKRVYFIVMSTIYRCDTSGTLYKYTDVPLTLGVTSTHQQLLTAGAKASKALAKLTTCVIRYQLNEDQPGLVTLQFRLEDTSESINLLHQVHVKDNYL